MAAEFNPISPYHPCDCFSDHAHHCAALPLQLLHWRCRLQVGLETLCVIICSLMLVSVFKTGKRYVSDEEEAEFMARCWQFIREYR